ncbi:Rrf2 family transcriptional regulator [Paracoccus sp. (in: a-proteobacteria)]|uniref:RrF2 family transcriptional regulator n=1 Tax=Paracoccus sp. TaxID=267 RepID=UPI00321F6E2C
MRLTSFTEYGLRALMRMAGAPERGYSSAELAGDLQLSRHHLAKIVQALVKGGYVVTRRGGGGGAMLARPPDQIRLGEVVRLLERDQALVECFGPDGGDCTLDGHCLLRHRLRAAEEAFLHALNQSTLAQVALPAPNCNFA